jgi:hypothetical protein
MNESLEICAKDSQLQQADGYFKHKSLQEPTRQIRLFVLYDAPPGSNAIHGFLKTFSLETDCLSYLAVSYEWGATDTRDFIVNGQRLSIRTNLWSFLQN